MSTSTEQTIQLPPDVSPANKNLLRAIEVDLATGSTFEQVVILGDSLGNLVGSDHGKLAVADHNVAEQLERVVSRLDHLIGLMERLH